MCPWTNIEPRIASWWLAREQRRNYPVRLPMHLIISCCEDGVRRLMSFETPGHFPKVLAASCLFLYQHSTRGLAPIWQLSFPFLVELGPLAAHDGLCHPWYRVESRLVAVTPPADKARHAPSVNLPMKINSVATGPRRAFLITDLHASARQHHVHIAAHCRHLTWCCLSNLQLARNIWLHMIRV